MALALATSAAAARTPASGKALVDAINRLRVAHGLRPLRVSGTLATVAAGHDRDLGEHGYFGHTSPSGAPLQDRIPGAWRALGENVAMSSAGTPPRAFIEMWLASPRHRRNLLDPRWRQIGVGVQTVDRAPGVYAGANVELVTADFAG